MAPSDCAKDGFTDCWTDEFFKGTVHYNYSDGKYAKSYSYIDSSVIDDQAWRGKYSSYPGGGFIQDLPLHLEDALKEVARLRNISWMDGGTRFLAADFNTYNPSTGLHTVARLAWEMPTGGMFICVHILYITSLCFFFVVFFI